MEIKTIKYRLDNASDFDKEINEILKNGFTLKKRYLAPGFNLGDGGYFHNMLVAELERDEKPKFIYSIGSENTVHELKIAPLYFEDIKNGTKKFEVRKDDREPKYSAGDVLILREWNGKRYTGQTLKAKVTYVLRAPAYVKKGYCIMSLDLENV